STSPIEDSPRDDSAACRTSSQAGLPVEVGETLGSKRVVFLVNFVAPNHVEVLRELASIVGELIVLSSVDMESNRSFDRQLDGLNVVVQKTLTRTKQVTHPSGYREINYVHVPLDTKKKLREFSPDAVVSLEMGMRSLQSWWHCRQSSVPWVLAVYASERSEAGRGKIRDRMRRFLLKRSDVTTFNGPSCERLLHGLGADPEKLMPWDYAADPRKLPGTQMDELAGSHNASDARGDSLALRLLTIGQLSTRKGVMVARDGIKRWCETRSDRHIIWDVVGDGPLAKMMAREDLPANLELRMRGNQPAERLADFYRACDWFWFPTMGDEWGLVVDEALHWGRPVLGSVHSQAATTLIQPGMNGFLYDPEAADSNSLSHAMDRIFETSLQQWSSPMRRSQIIESVRVRTPRRSAEQLAVAIYQAMQNRR
ncbi:MAG: glycosyltransferase, partial [Planctomycetota bacterium]